MESDTIDMIVSVNELEPPRDHALFISFKERVSQNFTPPLPFLLPLHFLLCLLPFLLPPPPSVCDAVSSPKEGETG